MRSSISEWFIPKALMPVDNYAGSSAATPLTDIGNFRAWQAVFFLGANSSPSILFKLQQAKDVLGAGMKDVPGKTFTYADPATSQRLVVMSIVDEDLDLANGYKFLRARVEATGGTTTQLWAFLSGFEPLSGSAIDRKGAEVLAAIG
jgi:hypothetical protein